MNASPPTYAELIEQVTDLLNVEEGSLLLADQATLRDVILFPAMRNLPSAGLVAGNLVLAQAA